MNDYIKLVRGSIKHWYVPLLIGLLFIAVGVYVFVSPLASYLTLSILFTITFLISGASDIVFSIANRKELDNWGWILILGILTFILGIMMLINPGISIAILPIYVGFVIMFRSFGAISISLDLKENRILSWGNLMVLGVLGVLFSFILIWNPLFAGLSIVVWTALGFITLGVYGILFSLKLKKLKDAPTKISQKLKQKMEDLDKEIKAAVK